MSASSPKEIVLADPHPVFRLGLRYLLQEWFPGAVIRETADIQDLLLQVQQQAPDLIISELHLPPGDLLEGLERSIHLQRLPIIVYSHYREPKLVRQSFKLGISGYLHKSSPAPHLKEAILQVLRKEVFMGEGIVLSDGQRGEVPEVHPAFRDYFHLRFELTRREIEVLAQIKKGLNNREIADLLYISEQTVSVHRKNILRKVGVNNTQKLLHITYEHHLA